MRIVHSRLQHGVGQGSFHSASVEVFGDDETPYRFDYVYDCGALVGSTSSPSLLRSLKRMDLTQRAGSGGRAVLDALVLSHYDRDHIIGAALLANQSHIRRIYVPFLSAAELALVVAGQAGELEAAYVRALHALANDAGTLFGAPVTMVQPGDDGDNQGRPENPVGPKPERDANLPGVPHAPVSLEEVDAQTMLPVGGILPAGHEVALTAAGLTGLAPWVLKFWNRGLDDNLTAFLFEALIECDFPVAALSELGAADELLNWLELKANREAALKAYRDAIAAFKPAWIAETSGQRLSNFLSLGLYSGPAEPVPDVEIYEALSSQTPQVSIEDDWYPVRRRYPWHQISKEGRVGWLGTGDAPLGEPDIWIDFSTHYAAVLPRVLTVQVPHHGAAPAGGPKFFNPDLIGTRGMNAVVSVGTNNIYGHPRAGVLKEVMAKGANLEVVTEHLWLGFHEVVELTTP